MSGDKGSSGPQVALRRIGEDSLLRPFLSGLFDPQAYVRNIIRDGKSEECFNAIIECVESINDEIKKYISQHKDALMSGMQDVATLADRYTSLAEVSKTLQTNILRLKKELADSYGLVRGRTYELERIHDACQLLSQVKQFATAKGQLDEYLHNSDDKDARSLATAAKTVAELERLLSNPRLLDIKMIATSAASIKAFASNIRILAQTRLLEAVSEKNQVAMANYLQVFFNLDSLPEVTLMVIDHFVKLTLDSARDTLDLDHLHVLYHEYLSKSPAGGGALVGAAATSNSLAASKKGSSSASLSSTSHSSSASNPPISTLGSGSSVTIMQLRIAIRELAHAWSGVIYDRATQIMVFQRVIQKKEDPTTHEKFVDVLRRTSAKAPAVSTAVASMQQGQLLQLYWGRLSAGLVDLCHDKLRLQPAVASRVYPYLRRAAIEVVENVSAWSSNDKQQDQSAASQFIASLHVVTLRERNSLQSDADLFQQSEQATGAFGSLLWGQFDLLGGMPRGYFAVGSPSAQAGGVLWPLSQAPRGESSGGGSSGGSGAGCSDHDLLEGLRPLRDRYLAHALERMNVPILQMFPEVEGYTAAIPSRRDLQTLTKAMQTELTTAVVESDVGLVSAISKELVKVVRLMLSKLDAMVINNAETRKISLQNGFARSHSQEQNAQLFALLMQFREILEAIPVQVTKMALDGSGSMVAATASVGAGVLTDKKEALLAVIHVHVLEATHAVDDVSYQIVQGIVSLLAGYSESILLGIHKEGTVQLPGGGAAGVGTRSVMFSGMDGGVVDCSLAVQTLTKQLPNMLKAHLVALTKSPLVEVGLEEVAMRIMQSFVSMAAVTRPVSEQSRLRTAQDMAAIEQVLAPFCNISAIHDCPIVSEYRAFRRLLFQDLSATKAVGSGSKLASALAAPDGKALMQLDYVGDLRPSTLLAYLVCCGPTQLPLPHEALGKDLGFYIDGLLDCTDLPPAPARAQSRQQYTSLVLQSLRGLYNSKSRDGWKRIRNEKRSWDDLQQALDVFFQRIAVAEGEQKVLMRQWYEAIIDIGSHYFK